ncbi:MAG TPA: substrate-binding domain-containing protein [Coriobacteriia bacterium]|jgi:phosphate transport system substrate-binding protein
MLRRTRAALVAASLLVVVVTAACSTATAPQPESGAPAATRLRVSGSGTCLPLLRILTRDYADKAASFVYLPGLHSGGGIKGVANGDLEIGAVSRDLDPGEVSLGLRYTLLSRDGLALAVHPSVKVTGLTSQQVRDIYAGKITNWSQVGGQDARIHVLDRNEDESAKIILRKFILGPLGKPGSVSITPNAIKLYYEPDMVEALTSTPGAIGYFSLGYGLSEKIPVTYLKLDGVTASVENVENGTYKVVRPLGIVLPKHPDAKTARFVEWASGPEAAALMKENGYAPARR